MNASHKVLVVDDDPVVLKSIDRVLSGKGYAVITAANGEEALRKLNEEKYDVVYTDIRMPGISGLEVAEQVKARRPWTPVVIMTGYGTEAARIPRQGRRRLQLPAQTAVAGNDRRQRPRRHGGAQGQAPVSAKRLCRSGRQSGCQAEAAGRASALKNILLFFAAPFIGLAYIVVLPFVGMGVFAVLAVRAAQQERRGEQVGPGGKEHRHGRFAAPMVGLAYILFFPLIGLGDIAVAGGPGGDVAREKLSANGQLGLVR